MKWSWAVVGMIILATIAVNVVKNVVRKAVPEAGEYLL